MKEFWKPVEIDKVIDISSLPHCFMKHSVLHGYTNSAVLNVDSGGSKDCVR